MKTPSKLQISPEMRRSIRQVDRQTADLNVAAFGVIGGDNPVKFTLAIGDEEMDFEFGARAFFRMGTAERPFELTEISDPKRSYTAMITWLWACLSVDDADAFPEPEDLSGAIPHKRLMECAKVFIKAVADYNTAGKAVGAKASREKPSDTPAHA